MNNRKSAWPKLGKNGMWHDMWCSECKAVVKHKGADDIKERPNGFIGSFITWICSRCGTKS